MTGMMAFPRWAPLRNVWGEDNYDDIVREGEANVRVVGSEGEPGAKRVLLKTDRVR